MSLHKIFAGVLFGFLKMLVFGETVTIKESMFFLISGNKNIINMPIV